MWWRIAFYIAITLVQAAMYQPPPGPVAATADDFNAPKSKEGDPIYDGAGTFWVKDPHVSWFGDFRSRGIYKKGGKK